ncbi:MAG: US12 family protein [Candidatus Aegiribacteria sp.]|nr:US12 family protein [Candidatus Aegiribacteria sp.]
MENTVFNRTENDSGGRRISKKVYNLVIGLVLCWGFFASWLIVKIIPYKSLVDINIWVFFLGYFASCFIGFFIFTKSVNPFISFIGYNFVVVPFGLIINIVVYQYDPGLVLAVIRVTGLVTIVMMILGSLYPAFFNKIARALSISLIIVIIVELIEILIFQIHHGIIDWIVVVIFCGYVGLDWSRANQIPKTLDNAVDSAASLYMDIIILFLRILRIMGRRN